MLGLPSQMVCPEGGSPVLQLRGFGITMLMEIRAVKSPFPSLSLLFLCVSGLLS